MEQYTCDRCFAKINGHPKYHGEWSFSIGLLCVMKRSADGGHLCDECYQQVKVLMEVFWKALFPKLRKLHAAGQEDSDDDIPL
jgi:hypothetical protein